MGREFDADAMNTEEEDVITQSYAVRSLSVTIARTTEDRVLELHENMGHASSEPMCEAVYHKTWMLDPDKVVTCSEIRKVLKKTKCIDCILAKRNLDPPRVLQDRTVYTPGAVLSSDIVGPISPQTMQGHIYFFIFKDMSTGMVHVPTGKTKDEYTSALTEVISWYKQRKWVPTILRSDNDSVIDGQATQAVMAHNGLRSEHSAPYRHFQNGAERDVQTLEKKVAVLLHSQPLLEATHWNLALYHAAKCMNHTPNKKTAGKSPYHILTGEATDLRRTFRFKFGDLVAVGIPLELQSWKFDLKNDLGIYISQPEGMVDSALVYMPHERSVVVRGSVCKVSISNEDYLHYYQRRLEMKNPAYHRSILRKVQDVLDVQRGAESIVQPRIEVDQDGQRVIKFDLPIETAAQELYDQPLSMQLSGPRRVKFSRGDKEVPASDRVLRPRAAHVIVARVCRGTYAEDLAQRLQSMETRLREEPKEREPIPDVAGAVHHYRMEFDPVYAATVIRQAYSAKLSTSKVLDGDDAAEWELAIEAEMNANILDKAVIAERPQGVRGVDWDFAYSTMQYKIKLNDDGSINKYKARCCIRGDMLKGKIDETYSPTIGLLAHAVTHQIAIIDAMHTCIVDTTGAYLYEDYPESAKPLYIKLEPRVAELMGRDPNQYYRVKKYLYGLPDAGRAYYMGYSAHLIAHGYTRTLSDPCLFTKISGTSRTYVWIHVDDTFVASTDPAELKEFQRVIGLKYEYTVQENPDSYLGVHLTKLPDGSVMLTQPKLLKELFDEFKPEEMRGTSAVNAPRRDNEESWDTTEIGRDKYLHLLGILIYLVKSRPDIATAISFASVHSKSPTVGAYNELLRCVQYLWNTQEKGLILHRGESNRALILRCYVDASYLTHADSKSHTGYCMSFGDIGTFYSKTSKQQLVATSSTHAEARALYQVVLDIIYVIHLCEELGRPIDLPAIVLEDNQPVLDLADDHLKRAKKSRHFMMLIHFVAEQVSEGLIELAKVASEQNVADILTKIMTGTPYSEKADQLLGRLSLDLVETIFKEL
jgi:hypothetical protein